VRGRWSKADLWSATLDAAPRGRQGLRRQALAGPGARRFQLRREQRALAVLSGLPGVPALVGRLDDDAFAMERVEGTGCRSAAPTRGAARCPNSSGSWRRRTAAAWFHNDLRGRKNVLAAPDGSRVAIIDWGGAPLSCGLLAPPAALSAGPPRRRGRAPEVEGAVRPDLLTEYDRAFLRRFRRWRRLWPFKSQESGVDVNEHEKGPCTGPRPAGPWVSLVIPVLQRDRVPARSPRGDPRRTRPDRIELRGRARRRRLVGRLRRVAGPRGGLRPAPLGRSLRRNAGQSAAFAAGFRAARGEIVVTLDADGQNPRGRSRSCSRR